MLSYWWTRLFVRIVVFCTILAIALVVARLLFWVLLGALAYYLFWKHQQYNKRHYASEDDHYPWRE